MTQTSMVPAGGAPSAAMVSSEDVRAELMTIRRMVEAMQATSQSSVRRMTKEDWAKTREMAKEFHEAGLFKQLGFKTEAQVVLAMVKAYELDLPGVSAVEQLRVIHDRLEPSARLMEALATQRVRGAWVEWINLGDDGEAICVAHRAGRPPIRMKFSQQDAENAKLDTKETYERYPADLLRSGALRKACRLQYGEVYMGFPPPTSGTEENPSADFFEIDDGNPEVIEGRGAEVVSGAPTNGTTATQRRTRGPAKTRPAAQPAAGAAPVGPPAGAAPAADPTPPTTAAAPAAPAGAPQPAPAGAAAPGAPEDLVLPFKTPPYAGKKLSDLVELDFRTLMNGYRDAIERDSKPTAPDDKKAKLGEKQAWLTRLEQWANYRGIKVPPLQKPG